MSDSVLDQSQDINWEVQRNLTAVYGMPEFVKTASGNDLYGDADTLPDNVYAYPTKRLYPCHTKSATWLSALFWGHKKNAFNTATQFSIEDGIKKAATYWGIENQINELWEKMAGVAQNELSGLPDSDFALVWEGGGNKERAYPLRNAVEVRRASEWFAKHASAFTYVDRQRMALRILEKAADYGAIVHDQDKLEKCAGYGYCPKDALIKAWELRADMLKRSHAELSKEAATMAITITDADLDVRDHGVRVKLASLMDAFDRATGLIAKYDDALCCPEDVLFQITEKKASEFMAEHIETVTGTVYEKTAIERIDSDVLREWLGDDIIDACGGMMLSTEKLAEIIPTLPRPSAAAFDQAAAACGVSPVGKLKVAQQLSQEARETLAQQYVAQR